MAAGKDWHNLKLFCEWAFDLLCESENSAPVAMARWYEAIQRLRMAKNSTQFADRTAAGPGAQLASEVEAKQFQVIILLRVISSRVLRRLRSKHLFYNPEEEHNLSVGFVYVIALWLLTHQIRTTPILHFILFVNSILLRKTLVQFTDLEFYWPKTGWFTVSGIIRCAVLHGGALFKLQYRKHPSNITASWYTWFTILHLSGSVLIRLFQLYIKYALDIASW